MHTLDLITKKHQMNSNSTFLQDNYPGKTEELSRAKAVHQPKVTHDSELNHFAIKNTTGIPAEM